MSEKKYAVYLTLDEMSVCQKAVAQMIQSAGTEQSQSLWALIGKFAMAGEVPPEVKLKYDWSPDSSTALKHLDKVLVEGYSKGAIEDAIADKISKINEDELLMGITPGTKDYTSIATHTGHMSASTPNIQQLKKSLKHAENYSIGSTGMSKLTDALKGASAKFKELGDDFSKVKLKDEFGFGAGWEPGEKKIIKVIDDPWVPGQGKLMKFPVEKTVIFNNKLVYKDVPYMDAYGEEGWQVKTTMTKLPLHKWAFFKALRIIDSVGNHVMAIKTIRTITGMGLKEAKDAYEQKQWIAWNKTKTMHDYDLAEADLNKCMDLGMVFELADTMGRPSLLILYPDNLTPQSKFQIRVAVAGPQKSLLLGLLKAVTNASFTHVEKATTNGSWLDSNCTVPEMESHPFFQNLMKTNECVLEIMPV